MERYSSLVSAVMLDSNGSGQVVYRDKTIDSISIQGVSPDFGSFSMFNAERGRLMSAIEVERSRPVAVVGWDVADRLFGTARSAREDDSDRGRPFPDCRRQRQARLVSRAARRTRSR